MVGAVHLTPKTMAVLLCLAERPREVVSHGELLRAVWGDGTGSHERLSHAISEIRQALNDQPNDPTIIETLPRRGYRLLVDPGVAASPDLASGDERRPQRLTFFDELKRRGVLDTALAYLVVGWLLIQVAAVTFQQLPLPSWAPTFVTYLVIVGFPIALLLAWFVEITPKGVILDLDPGARPPHRVGKPYRAIIGALAIASVGVLVYDLVVGWPVASENVEPGEIEAQVAVDPNSIAVLPFLNIGDDERGAAFSLGLADDVIDRLTRVPSLKVSSRGDSFSLAPNSTSKDVRRRLRVAYYLEGSVRIVGESLRVVVQLIDSGTGFHLVSRTFDHQLKDFFAVQDEITSLTVANLRVALPAATQTAANVQGHTTLDAYLLYSMGMDALYQPMTKSTIGAALAAFRQALDLDPGYAAAHAGICRTYASGYRVVNDPSYIEAAEKSCATALGLNPNLDVVHEALGKLYYTTGRYEEAEAAFGRALAINPNSASSMIGLGDVYAREQRSAEAQGEFERAVELQPGSSEAYSALGAFLFDKGRYAEAANEYREVISLGVDNMNGWTNLGAALTLSGQFDEAAAAYERSIALQKTPAAYSNLGLLYYYRGDFEKAIEAHQKAVDLSPSDYLAWSNLGDALSFSEMPARATAVFSRAEQLAESARRVNGRDAGTIADLAWIKAMLGKTNEAIELADQAVQSDPHSTQGYFLRALVLAHNGERAKALDDLEGAVERGYSRAIIAAEPHLRGLRGEPRFQALVARNGP
jgi:tetratricopeptide (TPR) repeat protein/TolB-like protein